MCKWIMINGRHLYILRSYKSLIHFLFSFGLHIAGVGKSTFIAPLAYRGALHDFVSLPLLYFQYGKRKHILNWRQYIDFD